MRRLGGKAFGALDNECLRSVNEAVVLNLVRERQAVSRADLARLTLLKASTISSIVKTLLDADVIHEADLGQSSGGRKPRALRINGDHSRAISVDVGIRETSIGVSKFNGEIVCLRSFETERNPDRFLLRLLDEIDSVIRFEIPSGTKVQGIGISLPGLLDRGRGTILYSANLGWRGVELGDPLRNRYGDALFFEDDVRAAGLTEIWFGSTAASRPSHMVDVVVKEGLGTALIVGGQLYRGASFGAGQFGHVSLDPAGPACRCGNRGCWEVYASDTATVARYCEYAGASRSTFEANMADVVTRACRGEAAGVRAVRETGGYLGAGIAILVNTLEPEVIVVDGQIGQAWNLIEPEIWRVLRARALAPNYRALQLKPSSIKGNASLMGATTLVLSGLFAVLAPGQRTEYAAATGQQYEGGRHTAAPQVGLAVATAYPLKRILRKSV